LSQADAEEIAEPNVSLTSVYGPDHVRLNQLFRVHATLRGVDERSLTLVLFDMLLKKILATFTIPSMRTGIGIVGLNVLSPQTEGRMILAVILLYWNGKDWSLLRKAYPAYVEVAVSNSVRLSVIAPYRQVSVTFDDKRIPAGQNGIIIIEASPGLHTLSVDEVYYIDDRTRVVFAQWSDGSRSPHRLIDLKRDVILGVHYVKQFLVMALTRFGNVSGVGWYDANSTVTLTLAPPVVEVNDEGIQVAYVFSHWEHDKALNDSAITFSLTSPMDVRAVWVKLTLSNGETSGELPWASFFFSVTFLALSILIGLKAVWKWFRSISVSNRRTAT
jgi:hypothetical protein